ncbi:helix-turn-helix transcriptional regulator [Nonomuraea sp. NPDC049784]|uniref:helix-turn-helix transcriptional regulator n=1 Tax=Nonomuraea sp. NPDC049784 TaxID=3154361 RepID=UPI0033E86A26
MDVTARILTVLLELPEDHLGLSPLEICDRAELPMGTIHPQLARLEGLEWITSAWETGTPPPGRPRRRLYRLTPFGRARVRQALGHYDSVPDELPADPPDTRPSPPMNVFGHAPPQQVASLQIRAPLARISFAILPRASARDLPRKRDR